MEEIKKLTPVGIPSVRHTRATKVGENTICIDLDMDKTINTIPDNVIKMDDYADKIIESIKIEQEKPLLDAVFTIDSFNLPKDEKEE